MPWIDTGDIEPGRLTPHDSHQIYNGLDSMLTSEIFAELSPMLASDPAAQLDYQFKRAMQAPALDMMRRGIRIDAAARAEAIDQTLQEMLFLEARLNQISQAVWDQDLNARSPDQIKKFFYGALRIPEVVQSKKGVKSVSTDREALEKIQGYFYGKPPARLVLGIRDKSKLLSTLRSAVDADGRMRTSYNVASTETGRWSSSENAFGTGTNLQNITEKLRYIFISDPGYKMAYVDLEQAESRAVGLLLGLLLGDWTYLDACESGDLHTEVAKMCWPELPWTGDPDEDRAIADRPAYRDFSYRDLAKRLGHGSNYGGTAWTLSRVLRVDQPVVEEFQRRYYSAFPLRQWHSIVATELQLHGAITTPLGIRRQFFGRLRDDSTLREAIAFVPQSMVGYLLNLGMWRVFTHEPRAQLLAQVHDAILFQYPEEQEAEVLTSVSQLIRVPVPTKQRTLIIPNDATSGWNWGKYNSDPAKGRINLDGQKKWKGDNDNRRRTGNPEASILDRRVRRVHGGDAVAEDL